MEQLNNFDNTSLTGDTSKSEPLKIFKKIIIVTSKIIIGYVILGFVLILISPVFGWLVFAPVFIVQGFISQFISYSVEKDFSKVLLSDITLPSELLVADCVGFMGGEGFMNKNHPRIKPFVEKLGDGEFVNYKHCKISDSEIVFREEIKHGSYVVEAYLVKKESLTELVTLDDILYGVLEDDQNNTFLTLPSEKSEGAFITSDFYLINKDRGELQAVKNFSSDRVNICTNRDKDQCSLMALEKSAFNEVSKLNYERELSVKEENSAPAFSNDQLEAIVDLIKKTPFNLSSIGYGNSYVLAERLDGVNSGPIFSQIAISPNGQYALTKISDVQDPPPWRIYIVVIDLTLKVPAIINILDPAKEISFDLVKDGRNTNGHYNFAISRLTNSGFELKIYDGDTQITFGNYEIEYVKTYMLSDNKVVRVEN